MPASNYMMPDGSVRATIPSVTTGDLRAFLLEAGATEAAARIWRALGFPDVPEGVGAFSDRDARALRFVTERLEGSLLLPDLEHQVRVVSASLARLAAFEADLVADALDTLRATGADEESVAMAIVEEADWDAISELIDYT